MWIKRQDNVLERVSTTNVRGPVYVDSPFRKQHSERRPQEADQPPFAFAAEVYREFGGVMFAIGDEIYFPDGGEDWIRQQTGHTKLFARGHLIQICPDDTMLVMVNAPCPKGVRKFLFSVSPGEVEVLLRCNATPHWALIETEGPRRGAGNIRKLEIQA